MRCNQSSDSNDHEQKAGCLYKQRCIAEINKYHILPEIGKIRLLVENMYHLFLESSPLANAIVLRKCFLNEFGGYGSRGSR